MGLRRCSDGDPGRIFQTELAQLRAFRVIDRKELIRYFTLTPPDEAFVRKFWACRTCCAGRDGQSVGGRRVLGLAGHLDAAAWKGLEEFLFVRRSSTTAHSQPPDRRCTRLTIIYGIGHLLGTTLS
jgi:hypothetical protein